MSCVVVLGCYRSGTSIVAGTLHKLGLFMGERFTEPNGNNPHGYYEDLDFQRLEKIYDYRRFICKRQADHEKWGVKDPAICKWMNNFKTALDEENCQLSIIDVQRDPTEICKSIAKAIGYSEPSLYQPLVQYYLTEKQCFLDKYSGPILQVQFDDLNLSPKENVEKIANFVGLPVTNEALEHIKLQY